MQLPALHPPNVPRERRVSGGQALDPGESGKHPNKVSSPCGHSAVPSFLRRKSTPCTRGQNIPRVPSHAWPSPEPQRGSGGSTPGQAGGLRGWRPCRTTEAHEGELPHGHGL